ncbi:MAG: helix-turn-helix domain-containing protein [Chloroflexota bacterium]
MSSNSEWVSLRHAADILGVHPATVRNWADRGDLPTRRTPGGHRRFRRSDLVRIAETTTEESHHGADEVKLILQNALGQARMQVGRDNMVETSWYNAMSDETRAQLREQGREVLEAMRGYLEDPTADDQNLVAAVRIGKTYAKALHDDAMSLPDAMRGFFYFSDFISDSVLSWSEVSAPRDHQEWAKLLRQINQFEKTMLLSIVEYYEED